MDGFFFARMKRIWKDLIDHLRTDVKKRGFIPLLLFTAALVGVYYGFDVKRSFVRKLGTWEHMVYYQLLYFFVYYTSVWIMSGFEKLKDREFILRSAFFIFIISAVSGFYFHYDWVRTQPHFERYFLRGILSQVIGSVIIFIPILIYYYATQKKELESFYGLTLKNHNFKPYLILLLLMVPLILMAATQDDFLRTYPTFKSWKYPPELFGLSRNQMTAVYESFYLLDFIRVEFAFRGLLIIGLARMLGRQTVITMSVLYCVLHFNKPLGETISSLFGGYILGTVAYHQKNIVGGCLVHGGVAGLMELVAYLAHRL